MNLPPEITFAPPHVQAHYRAMIADGQTERWAVMCALQQPPGVHGTDGSFMEGRNGGEWLNQMPKHQADFMTREAKAAGIDISGKYYCSGLADKRGWTDPEAWVSGRDDVLRVAKKRKLSVKGQVNYEPPEQAPAKRGAPLAKDTVASLARSEMRKNPALSKREAAAKVREKHTPHWVKKSSGRNK